jgi:hypothetical protein
VQVLSKKAARNATIDKISALKSDFTYLNIKAPFDGVISAVYMHDGDMAGISKPILLLSAYSQKMLFSYASTSDSIEKGDSVLKDGVEIGKVSKIYPNAKNNLNIAEVSLSRNLKLKNDSYISIEVVTNTVSGCSLPVNTLLHTEDGVFVLEYTKNRFYKKHVDVIVENNSRAIIKPCVSNQVAVASESKLSLLPFYKHITIIGSSDEK